MPGKGWKLGWSPETGSAAGSEMPTDSFERPEVQPTDWPAMLNASCIEPLPWGYQQASKTLCGRRAFGIRFQNKRVRGQEEGGFPNMSPGFSRSLGQGPCECS